MSCDCRNDGEAWRTPEALHVDLRGLAPPEPMIRVLQLIDSGRADGVLIVHLDREPIFLYPELDDRGWSYEIVSASSGELACEDGLRLRLVRMRP